LRGIHTLAALVLTIASLPLASAGGFPTDCQPGAAATFRSVDAGPAGIYYVREYAIGGNTWVQIWQESNGVPGLQLDPTWNCGNPGDTMLAQRCVGRDCPPTVV